MMKKIIIIVIIMIIVVLLLSCNQQAKIKVTEGKPIMGTDFSITVYSLSSEKKETKDSLTAAMNLAENLGNLFSTYRNDSIVTFLNNEKIITGDSGFTEEEFNKLKYLINISLYYSRISDGAFDITVKPILDLYTQSFSENNRPPTKEEINDAMTKVGYNSIVLEENRIILKNDTSIVLGGIAKGYVVDFTTEFLKSKDIKSIMVNAGGDLRVTGTKPKGESYKIAITDPKNNSTTYDGTEYITSLKIKDFSVATSGNYERYFDKDRKYHHIIDPKTGYSSQGLVSVTIIAEKAIDADALATSVYVLGIEKGLDLIEELENTEGLLITEDNELIRSSGFSEFEFIVS